MYQAEGCCSTAASPHYICVCVFLCFLFVSDTSVVSVGGWALGCADDVLGTVRHPFFIFCFCVFFLCFLVLFLFLLLLIVLFVGLGGWAPAGCADNVSGIVRQPPIIFCLCVFYVFFCFRY